MKKLQITQKLMEEGVVAVLRGDSPEEVVEMAEQAISGGIKVIEVTMTVPFALKAIEQLAKTYSATASDPSKFAVIGVGTVLDPETARAAILSGAEFVVGPSLYAPTVTLCNRYRVPVLPGVMTIQEIQSALELGVDIVKLFPGNLFSPSMIKAIKGPMPQANLMPTGGVSLDNLADWIKAGAVAVGIGSDLTSEAVKTGDYSLVARKAEQYKQAYLAAKG
ncbi:bifunctional 2-keto-4-hydroxyglutarate aldolase/2-keto-3-deoxy-6-phosphogluconate aldolase [Paenibacillus senegalensis]|uniref:bifunctional 2-keto-4-hydroxyglutarate aldolase/2-keto-3-deoxy-6-phosphogluconate aldolase n=1 Tax=Paenibacillus senegalensis TaxID=1465766 RepID=UPI0002895AD7|nr:bifunctional 2-keto-4-hydroxyglutarate aldolase/2-keto-3-deoxy-6-phosphogluconate aldolase [Paenibacillus senegalensis]